MDHTWFHHIGVYSYRPQVLKTFCESDCGFYEGLEKLEQLRALELGFEIGAIKVPTFYKLIGVDHPSDVEKVERVLKETCGE